MDVRPFTKREMWNIARAASQANGEDIGSYESRHDANGKPLPVVVDYEALHREHPWIPRHITLLGEET